MRKIISLALIFLLVSCTFIVPDYTKVKPSVFSATPLNEAGVYEGYATGLGNTAAHTLTAPKIRPINNKIIMVSIGASIQNQISERFEEREPELLNNKFNFINLAQPAKDINDWLTDPGVWSVASNRLTAEGVLKEEVQIVWLQDDVLNIDTAEFINSPLTVKDSMESLIVKIKQEFPKVKHIFISARPYTGFTSDIKHAEPKGYYNGWACKWVVEDQIAGLLPAKPYICDDIYMWTNGTEVRLDGFFIERSDFNEDGLHLSGTGKIKFGDYMFEEFKSNIVSSKYVY